MPCVRRIVAGLSPRRSRLYPNVTFLLDKVAVGQDFLRVFPFTPVSITPPINTQGVPDYLVADSNTVQCKTARVWSSPLTKANTDSNWISIPCIIFHNAQRTNLSFFIFVIKQKKCESIAAYRSTGPIRNKIKLKGHILIQTARNRFQPSPLSSFVAGIPHCISCREQKRVNMKHVYNSNNTEFSVHRTLSVYHGVPHFLSVYHTCYCSFHCRWTSHNACLWPLYCSRIFFPDFFNLSSSSNIAKTTSLISCNCGYVKEKSSSIRLSELCVLYAAAACYIWVFPQLLLGTRNGSDWI